MRPIEQWMVADYIKYAGAAPSANSGNSLRGGLLRGGVMGGGLMQGGQSGLAGKPKKGMDPELANAPSALRRGALFSKTLSSAFTPKNPMKIPNLQQTIRLMTLRGNKHKLPGAGGGMMSSLKPGMGPMRAAINKLPV